MHLEWRETPKPKDKKNNEFYFLLKQRYSRLFSHYIFLRITNHFAQLHYLHITDHFDYLHYLQQNILPSHITCISCIKQTIYIYPFYLSFQESVDFDVTAPPGHGLAFFSGTIDFGVPLRSISFHWRPIPS